ALYIVRELLSAESIQKRTKLSTALRYFNNTTRRKSIAFVLSDLIDTNYTDALRVAGKKHDVIGIKLYDQTDRKLPAVGMLRIVDAESGKQKWVDTNSKLVRHYHEEEFFRVTAYADEVFKKAGCDLLHIRTDEDYVKVLQRFFISRS
ncbi:MAG: DUF58 domain-containing protein, partial [Chitinophagaceae bacterium]|nr:DUF58 domain-containing protein [Chitinophagaceae bacterium]